MINKLSGLQFGKTVRCYSDILKKISTEKSNTYLLICRTMQEAKRQYSNFIQYIGEQKSVIVKSIKQTKHELIITFKNDSTLVFTDNQPKCLGLW